MALLGLGRAVGCNYRRLLPCGYSDPDYGLARGEPNQTVCVCVRVCVCVVARGRGGTERITCPIF